MKRLNTLLLIAAIGVIPVQSSANSPLSGNPIDPGWYADPESRIFEDQYWMYCTYSAPYGEQTYQDAFSSPDLVNWVRHKNVITLADISWGSYALWAPSPIQRDGKYYYYFAANDIQNNNALGGVGVAVSDNPDGPFIDALGKPLIDKFVNGAQPIDPHAYIDDDGQAYLYYGGWKHCNVVLLKPDMISLDTFPDGTVYKEITPSGYVEGPEMLKRNGKYYFMWAEGGWTGPDYSVAYAVSDFPTGPFTRIGKILQQDPAIGTGAGHHSYLQVPNTDTYYITYHRHPLNDNNGNHRYLCIDTMYFLPDGKISPVKISNSGVAAQPLRVNVALNKPVTASGFLPNEEAALAVDGIINTQGQKTKWCTSNEGEKWLAVDLGKEELIDRWAVWHAEAARENPVWNTSDFKLQYSSDNTFWQDVDVVAGNTRCMTNRAVTPFTARYVRLYISQGEQNTNDAARIYEFALYQAPKGETRTIEQALRPNASIPLAALSQLPSRQWCLTPRGAGRVEVAQIDLAGRVLSRIKAEAGIQTLLPATGCGIRIVLLRDSQGKWQQVGKILSSRM